MRINSPESLRRARAAYARYGSWDAVMKAGTLSRDIKAAKTPLRVVSRPNFADNGENISLWVEPFSEPRDSGFLYFSRNSCAYNRETFKSRGHMLTEELNKKSGFLSFGKEVEYHLLMKATKRGKALAQEAQKLWDKYQDRIASGELEMVLYLPMYGAEKGEKGYSEGSVKMRPRLKK